MPKPIQNGIFALIICCILVLFFYWWLDKPIVYWEAEHHTQSYLILKWLTHIPEMFIALTILLAPIMAIRFCYQKWSRRDHLVFATMIALALAYFIRGPLKFVFARTWPDTWVCNNLSLLQNNVYGFHWFHSGVTYQAFPSGHETATVAVMAMLWIVYPRWRWLAVLISLLVAIGLAGMYYHFISDIIAGGFLGGLTAYYVAIIMGVKPNVAGSTR